MGARADGELRRVRREDLLPLPLEVAPRLLGARLRTIVDGAEVVLRITEVEAYHGKGVGDRHDPGSHARMGRTARNATMWGEPGHLYVYLSHGIHSCVNVVCGPEGVAGGILLRAGEVVSGIDVAAVRRAAGTQRRIIPDPVRGSGLAAADSPASWSGVGRDLARGPGRFGQASGLRHPQHDGIDAVTGAEHAGAHAELWLGEPLAEYASGPRVGVAGHAGTDAFPWRFWIPGDPSVSAFRWGRGAAEAAAALDTPGIGSVLE
ncbi:DNA-3-methyladenine glycosylase [Microbacterium azadirachtae]|uniref:DNA-3-methyladenine glycosylase n=1 Tax=Microbacterium azadirachtae TaxID=582680 RepID=UPI00088D810D|nr:DNA-3-methyladenine glycosylase [Microbacterium azadirachtae]SDL72659.1 DNA-3-methyladenine glycosylase [Microbacterium azadirachtae]SEG01986.1 DNA-3-methyladenine glycosylase [Microbacterium azadirachtae]SEG04627.1 DNA-3-methyladenine glycosylase [Microbacterium azadirachtae]